MTKAVDKETLEKAALTLKRIGNMAKLAGGREVEKEEAPSIENNFGFKFTKTEKVRFKQREPKKMHVSNLVERLRETSERQELVD